MRRFFASVQVRAAIGATLVVAVALVATAFGLLHLLQNDLADKADAQAAAAASQVAQALEAGADPQLVTRGEVPVQIEAPDGALVAASKNVSQVRGPAPAAANLKAVPVPVVQRSGPAPVPAKSPTAPAAARPAAKTEPYRWAAQAKTTVAGKPVTVYTAASLATEQSALRTVRLGMIGGLPLLLVLVAFMTWFVARRALRPVEAIRQEMAAITASTDLSRRVPVPAAQDEIGRLARTTNETLSALEGSVERQRRFVADASHELRSPIASLRTQLEVGVKHPTLLDLEGIVDDTVRLQDLAADLLLLARLDADARTPGDAPVDLAEVVAEVAGESGRGVVRVEAVGDLVVAGSREQLGRAVRNLVSNARRHAASEVRVVVRREGASVVAEVTDDGPGVPEAERERVFERFVRLDDGRSRDAGGAGLGLAIAREIAVHHGGTLTAHENRGGGALFRLTLPAN